MTIREAKIGDAEEIFELLGQFATSYAVDRTRFDRDLPAILADARMSLIVADVGDRAYGYSLAIVIPTLFAGGPIAEILELMVSPDHRTSGIGRLLIQEQAHWAKAAGCTEIVAPTRRAATFYEKLGFESTATLFKLKL
jgi:N-acetylglutamate synthase-like GNAT family acetyltransferase